MVDLVTVLFEYTPTRRITAIDACAHRYFDELRNPGTKLSSDADLPPLFNFSVQGNINSHYSATIQYCILWNDCNNKLNCYDGYSSTINL